MKLEIFSESRVQRPTFLSLRIHRTTRIAVVSLTMASSVDAKLLKLTKFPAEFSQKVDMQKVNVEVMKK